MRGGVARSSRPLTASVREEHPVYAEVLGGPAGHGDQVRDRAGGEGVPGRGGARPSGPRPRPGRCGGGWVRPSSRRVAAWRGCGRRFGPARRRLARSRRGGREAGVRAAAVITLAEAIFVYSDELSAGRRRRVPADPVQSGRRARAAPAPAGVAAARRRRPTIGRRSGARRSWPLDAPRALAVLALDRGHARGGARRLDLHALVGADGGGAYRWCPTPTGPAGAALAAGVDGTPRRRSDRRSPPPRGCSLRWARLTLKLVGRGALPVGCGRLGRRPPGDRDPAPGPEIARALSRSVWRRSTSCPTAGASGRRDAHGVACPPAAHATDRRSCTSTPRPCATAWVSSASCSATRSRRPKAGSSWSWRCGHGTR